MNKIATAIAVLAALSMPGLANAATCRDAHGHFVKCPTAAATLAAHASPAQHAATSHAAATPAPRCRNAKGQFAKCGTPGAHPV